MRHWWRGFGRNHRQPGGPVVTAVSAAELAVRAALVVAEPQVHRVVAAVAPGADVRRFGTLAAMWAALSRGQVDGPPCLVVLAQTAAESADLLAEAVAYFAPSIPVVLLHRAEELEDLGERYLRVVAAHPDLCDADAPVEVVTEPATGAALLAALRAAAPADLPIGECPPALAGPLRPPPGPPPPSGTRADADPQAAIGPATTKTGATVPAPAAPVVVAVASAKGGAGKSTTAVALAATLARSGRRVCLVDLDVRDGQLGALLGHDEPNVATLRADSDRITDATVLAHLVRDRRLSLHALLAPARHGDEPELLTGHVHRQILAVLRRHFDVIVLDCPVTYREPLLAGMALVEADHIVAVTTLAVTSLAGLRRMLHTLTDPVTDGGLGVPRRKFAVVVNGALNGVAVDREQVAHHTLGLPLAAVVPHAARDVLIATNTRRLDLLLDHPDLAPAYGDLAASCVPNVDAPSPSSSARRVASKELAA